MSALDYLKNPHRPKRKFVKCDECGGSYGIGDWPMCGGDPSKHTRTGSRGGYDPFTPYVDPHLLPASDPRANAEEFNPRLGRMVRGVRIESREQRRKLMKEQNIDWAPRPQGQGAEF